MIFILSGEVKYVYFMNGKATNEVYIFSLHFIRDITKIWSSQQSLLGPNRKKGVFWVMGLNI